jgi:hypothetical protein
MGDGKVIVITDVDRLIFDCPGNVKVLAFISGQWEWKRFVFGKDFVQFTITTE